MQVGHYHLTELKGVNHRQGVYQTSKGNIQP